MSVINLGILALIAVVAVIAELVLIGPSYLKHRKLERIRRDLRTGKMVVLPPDPPATTVDPRDQQIRALLGRLVELEQRQRDLRALADAESRRAAKRAALTGDLDMAVVWERLGHPELAAQEREIRGQLGD
jgi:hypothetical protein